MRHITSTGSAPFDKAATTRLELPASAGRGALSVWKRCMDRRTMLASEPMNGSAKPLANARTRRGSLERGNRFPRVGTVSHITCGVGLEHELRRKLSHGVGQHLTMRTANTWLRPS